MAHFLRRLRHAYYGWWMLAASVFAVAIAAGLSFWSFGLYVDPLESQFGWSRAEVSGGFSVGFLASAIAAPLIGWWIDRYGPRRIIFIGAVLTAGSYVLLATTGELWQWFAYQCINAVFRQMMFFIPFQALISRWFDRRRGLAVGLLGTGFSIGGFAVVPIMRLVIDAVQWEASFVIAGIVIVVVFVPLSLLLVRNDPSDIGAEVDGNARPTDRPAAPRILTGVTVRQALRTPLFWVVSAALTAFFFGMISWMVHGIPYYESVGYSPGRAALLFSIAAGGGVAARLTFGYLADRIPRMEAAAMVVATFLAGAFATLLLTDGSIVGVAIFLVFWIVGSSGGPMIEPLLLTRSFGLASFGALLGIIQVISTLHLTSPIIAGAIFDATGSYDWALVMLMGSMGLSVALFWVAWRLPRPQY